MTTYRSLETLQAVQYTGAPIEGVTCSGTPEEVQKHGCDSSRKHLPHVHTQAVGGMTVLAPGMWIFPLHGGPFGVAPDVRFRSNWEVPKEVVAAEPEAFPGEAQGADGQPVSLAAVPEQIPAPSLDDMLREAGLPPAHKLRKKLARLNEIESASDAPEPAPADAPETAPLDTATE